MFCRYLVWTSWVKEGLGAGAIRVLLAHMSQACSHLYAQYALARGRLLSLEGTIALIWGEDDVHRWVVRFLIARVGYFISVLLCRC